MGSGALAQGRDGGAGNAHNGVSSHPRDGGPVNGVNGTQGAVEWERKWDGVKAEPVVLDTENVFEVLKAVSTYPGFLKNARLINNRRLQLPRSVTGTQGLGICHSTSFSYRSTLK
jgi:hypothetical protein